MIKNNNNKNIFSIFIINWSVKFTSTNLKRRRAQMPQ